MPENGTYSADAARVIVAQHGVDPAAPPVLARLSYSTVWAGAVLFVIVSGLFGAYAVEQDWIDERNAVVAAFLMMAAILFAALILGYRHEQELGRIRQELERHVEEKEAQTREMNHRIKNSLQLVGALLRLQGKAAAEPGVGEQLEEASNRVATVARVHDRLYRSTDLTHIAGDEYLRGLCGDLQRTLAGVDADIRFNLTLDTVRLNADKAILIGLVVTELVSHAAKHGFLPGQKGTVTVVLQRVNGGLRLVISDDGERAPGAANQERSFGGTVVNSLVEQLDGRSEHHSGPDGNSVVVTVPVAGH